MRHKFVSLLLTFILGTMVSGVAVHPANATYNWNLNWINKLSQMANGSPAMDYNAHLGAMFMAYPSDVQCCGTVNVISSIDMITWTASVDTSRTADPGSMGMVYNPDDQKMYIVYEFTPNPSDPTVIYLYVISSSNGSSWSSPVFVVQIAEIPNTWGFNGPTIAFDSTNHRLLVDYDTYVRNNQGDNCGCNEVFLYQSTGPVFNQSWSLVTSTPIRIGGTDIGLWDSPGITFVNGKLYMAYVSQYDKSMHVIQSTDAITWTNRADFPGQSGYWITIRYNPVEQSFHMIYVGVTNPFYLYDNSSPDGISWNGPTKLSGVMSAESLEDPTMAFVPSQGLLLLAFTGTDGSFGCPCNDGHLYAMAQTPPSGGSVAFGTEILTPIGNVAVQNLNAGDTVISIDPFTQQSYHSTITSINIVTVDNMLIFHTDTAQPLRVDINPRLRFNAIHNRLAGLWSIVLLVPGDSLYQYGYGWTTITRIDRIYGGQHTYYDLHLDPLHDYVANGYSDCPCKT